MINFDSEPKLYWAVCNILLVTSALLSFYPLLKNPSEKLKLYAYVLLSVFLVTFVVFRLPVVVYNIPLNPDESVFIVGAMTLAENPVYWESVDGCTSGPFSFYAITAFCEIFRQPYDYVSARIVGLLLMLGSLILNFFTLRKFFSTTSAAISSFCVVAFLSTTRHHDFVHFGSEHLPIFLLSIIGLLYALMAKNTELKKEHLFWFGFVAGMVPFAKLQAAPISMMIGITTYWLIYQKKKQQFSPYFGVLTAGGLCVPLLLVASGISLGFLDDFWLFYIKNNLGYGSNVSILEGVIRSFSDPLNIFTKIILVLSIFIIAHKVLYKKEVKLTPISLFILVFVASSLFSVFKPGFMFHHYLLLLVFPTSLLFGYFIKELLGLPNLHLRKLSIGAILTVILSFTLSVNAKNEFVTVNPTKRSMAISPISQEILKYSLPNEPLVIWGESGRYYLESKRTQGIRWSHTYWGMYSAKQRKLFRQEYVKQFQMILAPVFIDTHAKEGSFIVRKDCGYETIPELKRVIDEKYHFLAEIDQQRIYVRNDRIAEINNRKDFTEINYKEE
ncbi:hypothetical protein [Emticicia sp. C21]|uniref:hypothetical protein n=1 Tax=Emticicia sp. C21 TaxID=2302915 RepID=UPI000E353176|nr:hypothetical protein [Emticicia sp. C21]RFS17676.1 hypothetical protein D0T08_00005 [Emticicia sp. C21]